MHAAAVEPEALTLSLVANDRYRGRVNQKARTRDALIAAVRDLLAQGVTPTMEGPAGPLVAERVPVARLVLLAPMIPKPGETAGQWWENTGHAEAIAELLARHGPVRDWGPEAFEEVFLHDVDPQVARESERLNRAPGAGMFSEPWPLEAWPDVPTQVLAPREDRLFPVPFQRRVARERLDLEVGTMRGGHLPMLARPRELAEHLLRLAGA